MIGCGRLGRGVPLAGPSVGLTEDDSLDQPKQFVLVSDQVSREPFEQIGVTRRIGRVHLIEWVNQASSEIHRSDEVAGEHRFVFGFESQFNELRARAEVGASRRSRFVVLRLLLDLFIALFADIGTHLDDRLVDFGTGQEHELGDLVLTLRRLEFHLTAELLGQPVLLRLVCPLEERGHAEIVVLLPVLDQRVIVALGATDVHAEENRGRLVRQFVEFSHARFDKRESRFDFSVVFAADQHVAEHLIPRAAGPNGAEKIITELAVVPLLSAHQQRVEFVPKMKGKVGRGHQPLDKLQPLVGFGRVHVALRLDHRWDAARHIERRPSNQCAVVGERSVLDLLLDETLLDVVVDDLLDGHLGREQLSGADFAGDEAARDQEECANQSHWNSGSEE